MKVNIGNHKNYYGPYQIAELLCFWVPSKKNEYGFHEKPEWVTKFGEFLAYGSLKKDPVIGERRDIFGIDESNQTWFANFLERIERKRKRKVKVVVDDYDVYAAYHTLALVILPVLKKCKEQERAGFPCVDDSDIPEFLRIIEPDNCATHWEYILDEMIFAFENVVNENWKEKFFSGSNAIAVWDGEAWVMEDDSSNEYDFEGYEKYNERIQNGLVLFGKYFQCLWN